MDFTLRIWRQKNAKSEGHFETYQVKNISPDSSFLEMLDILNEQLIHEGMDPVAVERGCQSRGYLRSMFPLYKRKGSWS